MNNRIAKPCPHAGPGQRSWQRHESGKQVRQNSVISAFARRPSFRDIFPLPTVHPAFALAHQATLLQYFAVP